MIQERSIRNFAQMYQDKASFDVTFEVYDYTASGIDYIAGDMYSAKTGHTLICRMP